MRISGELCSSLFGFLLFCLFSLTYTAFAAGGAALHHDLQVVLDLNKHELAGTDTIRVAPSNKEELTFSLADKYLDAAVRYIELYNRLLGKYSYLAFKNGAISNKGLIAPRISPLSTRVEVFP